MRKVLMVAVFIASMVSLQTGARAVEVMKETFMGNQVSTFLMGSASITCSDNSLGVVSTVASLQGAEQIFGSGGGSSTMSNGVFIDLQYFNSCTGEFIGGFGGIPNALTPPDRKLTSAVMAGSGFVQDFGTGQTIPITINVTVVGIGTMNQSKSTSKSKVVGSTGGPLQISTSHFANTNRSGTASGTITIGGVNINPDFLFAFLNLNDNSSMSVNK